MSFKTMSDRARAIRALYKAHEKTRYGQSWTREDIALGFMGDVGDLAKLVMAKKGIRGGVDIDARLAHELSDCLWSILILADEYGIDLETEFSKTMGDLESRLS